jgi:lysophospholipase L1-like esterase/AMMECR1 domain-containing protein
VCDLGSNFGSLGDFFPEAEVKCRVRGCGNTIRVSKEEVIQKLASGKSPKAEKMCDECFATFKELTNQELECSTVGCDGKWTWNRHAQLEAMKHAKDGKPVPPRGLCPKCREAMQAVEAKTMPCRFKGCKGTWTWSAKDQIASGGKQPPPRLCDECFNLLRPLKDDYIPCRIKDCVNSVLWTRYQQLEHIKSGKSLDNPPKRMCDECFKVFTSLKNEEKECKINGCKGTWTLTAYEQLEVIRNTPEGQEPEMPARMCKKCFDFYTEAKDIERPCMNKGCDNKWTWTRSMQLGAHIHGNSRPRERLCDECVKAFMDLKDEERPCSAQGCNGTWIYRVHEQIRNKCKLREEPKKRCPACQDFLANHQTEELTCESCGTAFKWSVHEQLDVHLGTSTKPKLCSDCVGKELDDKIPTQEMRFVNRPIIHIPSAGPWNSDEAIRNRPERMTQSRIDAIGDSQIKIICIGDELTLSQQDVAKAWPTLLENSLQERFKSKGILTVLNAAIKDSGIKQAINRFERDIKPFNPDLIVFSFAWNDAKITNLKTLDEEAQNTKLAEIATAIKDFAELCKNTPAKLLCWLPNPIYAQDCKEGRFDAEQFRTWAENQDKFFEKVLSTTRQACNKLGIVLVDASSMFKIEGEQTAKKWMASWYQHNEQGAKLIANWIEQAIVTNKLIDPEKFEDIPEPKPEPEPVEAEKTQAAKEPAEEPAVEESIPEPAAEPISEPVAEPIPEPVEEPTSEEQESQQ